MSSLILKCRSCMGEMHFHLLSTPSSLSRFIRFRQLLEEIRSAANKGMAIGSDRFKDEIEALTGRRMKTVKVGRRTGWRKNSGN